MNPGTWYVPEGETQRFEIVGLREANDEAETVWWKDGSALMLFVRAEASDSSSPVVLKQFGAADLVLSGLNPTSLDPGQVVEISRYEGGGYGVETDPDEIEGLEDAMHQDEDS